MGAVGLKTVADLRRRRVQAIAIALVLFLASGAGTLALSVLVESHEPFERAFAAANGAHLVVAFDGRTDPAAIAATRTTASVTASEGPWPVTRGMLAHPKGGFIEGALLSGRPATAQAVDSITPVAGRWWQAPSEVVLDQETARLLEKSVGDTVVLYHQPAGKDASGPRPGPVGPQPPAPTGPAVSLTVVGIARSVSTPNVAAWLSPTDITTLAGGQAPDLEMLYRVTPNATAADLGAAMAQITAGLASGAVHGSQTYLDLKGDVDHLADLYVPVLLAFAVFALLAAAFAITNVVSGIVLTSYREIGVMKAIGYTPSQVSAILLGQILVPVAIGTILGVLAGTIASRPIIADTAESFGVPASPIPSATVLLAVLGLSFAIAIVAALGPAINAGRLSAVSAMTRGATPTTGSLGAGLRQLGLRLPISLPIRLGISTALAHPLRAAMTLGALVVGVTAITFSLGLNASLLGIKVDLDRSVASPIRVEVRDASGHADDVTAVIAARPNTARFVSIGEARVQVPAIGAVPFVGYREEAGWTGYALIQGRWFSGPGEAVAPTNFFTVTGLHVGDTTTITSGGRSATVRLVGEIFDDAREAPDNLVIRGTWTDLAALVPTIEPSRWEIQPLADSDQQAYWSGLQSALGPGAQAFHESDSQSDTSFLLFLSVVGLLGAVLTAISLGGVFNTVLLETRQRTRELAVLKAIGFTPVQVIALVVASIVPLGLVAGLAGVPIGIGAQHVVLTYMGQVAAKTAIPPVAFDVFGPLVLIGLALAGLGIGVAGAYLPALRAARSGIAAVLQAE